MRDAVVGPDGARIRWVEIDGAEPVRVCRPDLVARLLVAEPALDPVPPPAAGSVGITTFSESQFASGGMAQILEQVGPQWAATMRLSDAVALHRSAYALRAGTTPNARQLLMELPIPRTYVVGSRSAPPAFMAELEAAEVRVATIPDAGHNVMLDNPTAFADEVARL